MLNCSFKLNNSNIFNLSSAFRVTQTFYISLKRCLMSKNILQAQRSFKKVSFFEFLPAQRHIDVVTNVFGNCLRQREQLWRRPLSPLIQHLFLKYKLKNIKNRSVYNQRISDYIDYSYIKPADFLCSENAF